MRGRKGGAEDEARSAMMRSRESVGYSHVFERCMRQVKLQSLPIYEDNIQNITLSAQVTIVLRSHKCMQLYVSHSDTCYVSGDISDGDFFVLAYRENNGLWRVIRPHHPHLQIIKIIIRMVIFNVQIVEIELFDHLQQVNRNLKMFYSCLTQKHGVGDDNPFTVIFKLSC